MKKLIAAISIVVVCILSCKSEKEKHNEKFIETIKVHINTSFNKKFTDFKNLDSIRITSIDTVTEKQLLNIPIYYSQNQLSRFMKMAEMALEIAKKKKEIANIGGELYGGYVNKLEHEKADEEFKNASKYNDSAKYVTNLLDSLIEAQRKVDSTTFNCYAVTCKLQLTKQDLTIDTGSATFLVTKDFKIIDQEQLARQYIKK